MNIDAKIPKAKLHKNNISTVVQLANILVPPHFHVRVCAGVSCVGVGKY